MIGRPHEIKGQAIAAFVTIKDGNKGSKELMEEIKAHVTKKIGALARPDDLIFAADLPKTRSGKIMRRLLRDIAEGKALGDTTTLADPAVVATPQGAVRRGGVGAAAPRGSREEQERRQPVADSSGAIWGEPMGCVRRGASASPIVSTVPRDDR